MRQSRFLASWLQFFETATDAPQDYGLASGLMCLSTIALGRRWIDSGRGIRPNLYMMLTGPSSIARKSTSVQFAADAIRHVEPSFVGPSDYTMEGLLKWMAPRKDGTRNRVTLFSEEFGADLARRESYGETMDTDFCALYDGSDFTKVRAKSDTITIEKPRVSFFAACAYPFLARYLKADDWHSGFLMRFCFVAPLEMRSEYVVQPEFPEFLWKEALDRLAWVRAVCEANKYPMRLLPEAQALYEASMGQVRAAMKQTDNHVVLNTYLGRYGVNILKLAMLFQLDIEPVTQISADAMTAALFWANRAIWPSFLSTYEITTSQDFDAVLNRVVGFVRQPGGILKTDLAQLFFGSRAFGDVLRHLQHGGLTKLVEDSDGQRLQWFDDFSTFGNGSK